MDKIIDINVSQIVKSVSFDVTPNLITINVNKVQGVMNPVISVNGEVGNVILDIPSIDGLALTTYVDNQDALKVDKITGKGLSSNDYTTTEKNKLNGISEGAEVNVNADWDSISGDSQILNKPSIPSIDGLATTTYVDNQDALKVDKVLGERLINATEITKLDGVATGAEVNVNADWNAISGDALILNKPVIPSTTNFVPYNGAISDVNLGEFGIQLGNLEFNLTPTNAPTTVGSLSWNDSSGTLDLKLKGGNTTLQIGQETVARIVNKTATNITLLEANYQAVRVTGAQGQRPKVDLAQANNDLNSTTTLGLVTETILNNEEGFITTSGQVQQINTTGSLQGEIWLDGDILYLSGTIAGRITNIKPIAPIHTVIIGFVEYAHAINGKIFVKVDNGYELEELHNVSAIAPNNNEVLAYDLVTTLWKPKTVISALGYTPVPNDLTISTTSPLQGGGNLSANKTLSILQSNTTTNGYLSSIDWNVFNNKISFDTTSSTRLANTSGVNTGDQDLSGLATTTYVDNQDALKVDKVLGERLINASEITKLANQSGINTGDQDLSGLATTTYVNSQGFLKTVGISNLTATGVPDATTYLRGDNTWATVSGGGSEAIIIVGAGAGSTLRCGTNNTTIGIYSTTIGGQCNINGARFSTISGGNKNVIQSPTNECCSLGTTIGGGIGHNTVGGTFDSATGLFTVAPTSCGNAGKLSTISGGFRNCATGDYSFIGGGRSNTVSGISSSVVGGASNTASGHCSTIGGGGNNNNSGNNATISGGCSNTASNTWSVVSGGFLNIASGYISTIGGGRSNTASAIRSVISGGYKNNASGNCSFVGGGACNTACGNQSSVVGGISNTSSGACSFIGGGCSNTSSGDRSAILGGANNTSSSSNSTVGGGFMSNASGSRSVVGGGFINTASGGYSFVGGGQSNTASTSNSAILGGTTNNTSTFACAMIVGSNITANRACTTFVNDLTIVSVAACSGCSVGISTNGLLIPIAAGGGASPIVIVGAGVGSTLRCGNGNTSIGICSTVSGGMLNDAGGYASTIGGGCDNTASGSYSTVAGGGKNISSARYSISGGGRRNISSGQYSTVSGGRENTASGCMSVVGGGGYNVASTGHSGILSGRFNNTSTFTCAMIVGSNITADRSCATFVNNLSIKNVPTSSAGLPSGSVWNNGGVLNIV